MRRRNLAADAEELRRHEGASNANSRNHPAPITRGSAREGLRSGGPACKRTPRCRASLGGLVPLAAWCRPRLWHLRREV